MPQSGAPPLFICVFVYIFFCLPAFDQSGPLISNSKLVYFSMLFLALFNLFRHHYSTCFLVLKLAISFAARHCISSLYLFSFLLSLSLSLSLSYFRLLSNVLSRSLSRYSSPAYCFSFVRLSLLYSSYDI